MKIPIATSLAPRLLIALRGCWRVATSIVLLACVAVGFADVARGTVSGDFFQLPGTLPPGQKPKSGLIISFDSTWLDGPGYRPIRIHVMPQSGTTISADRTLVIVVQPNNWSHDSSGLTVSQQIEIPAGSTGVDATIAVPQYCHWQQLSYETFEGGQKIEELSQSSGITNRGTSLQNGYSQPSIMFVSDWDPTISQVPPGAVPPPGNLKAAMVMNVSSGNDWRSTQDERANYWNRHFPGSLIGTAPMNYLPTRWIDYSSSDILCFSHDDLVTLTKQRPEAWKAIRQWVETGGSLWIYGLNAGPKKEDFAHLDELNKLLGDAAGDAKSSPWHTPSGEELSQTELIMAAHVDMNNQPMPSPSITPKPKTPPPGFKWRRLQFGAVVAIGTPDLQSSDGLNSPGGGASMPQRWAEHAIILSTGREQATWIGRHGMSFWHENPDFWNFQIPGVGIPPVGGFLILITLFVMVIGPLNFYLLRRWGRLNLTMLTVPLCAALVVTLLVGYAFMHDGLGTRLRARSFTRLDQTSGDAACHGRLSYYSGLTPGGGLQFPADCAVYPLEEQPNMDYYRQDRKSVRWGETEQDLSDGWLNARTPTQLYTVRSHKTKAALKISEAEDSPPKIENHLGTAIQLLVLRGSSGDSYYLGADIAVDAAATLQTSDQQTALGKLLTIALQQVLAVPQEAQAALGGPGRRYGGRYGGRYSPMAYSSFSQGGINFGVSSPNYSTSLLEQGLMTLRGQGDWPLQNRTYLAIVHHSPELANGLSSAREEASFHVILGRW